jgi:hypothetical protein
MVQGSNSQETHFTENLLTVTIFQSNVPQIIQYHQASVEGDENLNHALSRIQRLTLSLGS